MTAVVIARIPYLLPEGVLHVKTKVLLHGDNKIVFSYSILSDEAIVAYSSLSFLTKRVQRWVNA